MGIFPSMGTVSKLIAAAIKHRGFASKADVARAIGCLPTRLYEWEAGGRSMPLPRVVSLAKLAGADVAKATAAYVAERIREGHSPP